MQFAVSLTKQDAEPFEVNGAFAEYRHFFEARSMNDARHYLQGMWPGSKVSFRSMGKGWSKNEGRIIAVDGEEIAQIVPCY